jgi:sugar phosphate isomerase/epimerase
MDRRDFLSVAAGSTAAILAGPFSAGSLSQQLAARETIARSGPPRFQVALAAYSLRDYFRFKKGKDQTPATDGPTINMIDFLDYCVEHGFDAAELTSYFFKPDGDADYFRNIKREAFQRGLPICGTAIGNNFTGKAGEKLENDIVSAIEWIDRAALLGAPHIRFFAGKGAELAEHPERMQQAVDAIHRCAIKAAEHGIFLGIENHGNLTADQMLEIMKRIDDTEHGKWIGINLDTGNFQSEQPYADIERCLGYAVNVQVKTTMKRADKSKYPADITRIGKILNEAGYQGAVVLEYEEEKPYDAIPQAHEELRAALSV